jgi:ABC-type Zn2+ transport system substrate-binding protein/surface adhesin
VSFQRGEGKRSGHAQAEHAQAEHAQAEHARAEHAQAEHAQREGYEHEKETPRLFFSDLGKKGKRKASKLSPSTATATAPP